MEKLKSDSIEELNLPAYIQNTLIANGISTISQLIEQSETNKLYDKLCNFSTKDFDMIDRCLNAFDMELYDKDKKLTRNKIIQLIGIFNPKILRDKNGISKIGELIRLTQEELKELPNMNEKLYKRIIEQVHKNGLKFADELEEPIGIKLKPLAILHLTTRSIHALKGRNLDTISKLITYTEKDLMNIHNIGKESVDEIKKKIHSLGLKFADEIEETFEFSDFSVLSQEALKYCGISSIIELINMNASDFQALWNKKVKRKKLYDEIIEKMHLSGLKFADEREEENSVVENDKVEPINDAPSISEQMNQSKLDKLARIQELQNQIIALQQEQSILMQELNEELSKGDIHARQSK